MNSIKGDRLDAVKIALDLADRKIKFKYGGRSPQEGLDISGFIDYILSQPNIDIINDPRNCGRDCLLNRNNSNKRILPASNISELKPGDLIFYNPDRALMYLGNNKGVGMVFESKEVEIVDFSSTNYSVYRKENISDYRKVLYD